MSRSLVIAALAAVAALGIAAVVAVKWLRSSPPPPPPPTEAELPTPSGPQEDGAFRKVVLVSDQEQDGKYADTLPFPVQLGIADDGRLFFAELRGGVRMYDPRTGETRYVAKLEVWEDPAGRSEEGLLGLALDPAFRQNGWIYLHYSDPVVTVGEDGTPRGILRLSRFDFDGERLVEGSEEILFETRMNRTDCCHAAGGIGFDAAGNLYVGIGDNTPPSAGAGYACLDERPGHRFFDSQRTAANTADPRGKVLRIRPLPEGGYAIPDGNLFPPGTPDTLPEIYLMGMRNPWRLGFDRRKGILYVGEPGPDAGATAVRKLVRGKIRELLRGRRGPPGFDEINQARAAGNFGWPYALGPNYPYADFDYAANQAGELFEPERPVNESPNNTGLRELPPSEPALIYYPYGESEEFPAVGVGGRVAGAGPVYYFDESLESACKLPREYDHVLFTYDWMRNWLMAVHLDENEAVERVERFLPGMTFQSPIDLEIGPDGCMYVMEWGTFWGGTNLDSQIVRIEHRP